jgi:hypothetical protein
MMSPVTLTVILGLCGSGKSELIKRLKVDVRFDEGFDWNLHGEHERLISALKSGQSCAVIEVGYCLKTRRDAFVARIRQAAPEVTIEWKCFANDLVQANLNCLNRRDGRDVKELLRINADLTAVYTYPEDAEILPVWTPELSQAPPSSV